MDRESFEENHKLLRHFLIYSSMLRKFHFSRFSFIYIQCIYYWLISHDISLKLLFSSPFLVSILAGTHLCYSTYYLSPTQLPSNSTLLRGKYKEITKYFCFYCNFNLGLQGLHPLYWPLGHTFRCNYSWHLICYDLFFLLFASVVLEVLFPTDTTLAIRKTVKWEWF